MARTPIKLFGTWKNKLTYSRSVTLAKEIKSYIEANPLSFELAICPPMVALQAVAAEISGTVSITAQNMIWDDKSSFTGETSADSLVDVGCKYVMIGHSERRLYLGEDDEMIARKVSTALEHGLIPLICIGEFLEDYERGNAYQVINAQMDTIVPILGTCADPSQFIIAYEPAWAITTSSSALPCDPDLAEERHRHIRRILHAKLGAQVADNASIVYGAGVSADNVCEFLSQPNIDGGLAGGASQSFDKFTRLVDATRNT